MARINLLPWRAERRKQRQKDFATMLGGALIAACRSCPYTTCRVNTAACVCGWPSPPIVP